MSFQAICRVCTRESSEMLSIFESYNFSAYNCEIFKAITDCASVQIQKFDGFSEQICQRCLDHLTQAYSFKKLCEDSDYKFRTDLIASDRIKIKNEFPEAEFICCDTDNNAIENIARDASVSDIRLANRNTEERYEEIKTESMSDEDEFRIKEIEAARLSTPIITRTGYEGPSSLKDPQYIEEHTNGSPYTCELCSICRIHKEQLSEESNDQFRSEYSMTEDFKSEFSANETIIKCGDSDSENPVTMDSDFGLTERQNEASAASLESLPAKTSGRYEKEYREFIAWRKSRGVDIVNEDILLCYVSGLSKNFAPNSLWTKISMLKTSFKLHENVDISGYGKVFMFLRRKSECYKPKKAKVLTTEQITRFLQEAGDDYFLLEKVILVFGIFGACRRQELSTLQTNNIEDTGRFLIVTVEDTKNKSSRKFIITEDDTPFKGCSLYRKYAALRPVGVQSQRVFVDYRKGKCTKQLVGVHKIGGVPKKIAEFLKLEDYQNYTGHSFRRSSATMRENGGDLLTLKKFGGSKSTSVAEHYVEESVSKKVKISETTFQM